MPRGRRAARCIAGALAIVGATLLAGPGVAQASYGPPPPPVTSPGPGTSCVVTSLTAGQAGTRIGPLHLTGMDAVLRVRRGTFPQPAQLSVTQLGAADHGCQSGQGTWPVVRGYRLVGGIGILAQRGGTALRHRFRRSLALHLASPYIRASSLVVLWQHGRVVVLHGAIARRGTARIQVRGNDSYAVLTPARLLASLLARTTDGHGAGRAVAALRRDGALLHPSGAVLAGAGVLAAR